MATFVINNKGFLEYKASSGSSAAAESSTGDHDRVSKYTGTLDRDDYVPKKPVAAMSYGKRVRIARIYDSYEEFIGQ